MKVKLTLVASILAISVSAQQKTNTKAELDASNTIKLCNTVIGLSNKNRISADNYNQLLSTADSNMEKLKRNPDTQPFFVDYKNFAACFGDQKEYQTAYKNAPEFTGKKEIDNTIIAANKDIDNSIKWATNISEYFSQKTYLTDTDFSKYPAMQDSLEYYFERGYNGWFSASRLASKAGNDAQMILLQTSKLAQFVIPMKSDLNSLEAIMELFKQNQIDTDLVKSDLAAVSESVAKNKDISTKNVKLLSDVYYKEVFQKFYSKSEETIKSMETYNTELEKNTQSDRLESLSTYVVTNYRSVVEAYNTFIRQ